MPLDDVTYHACVHKASNLSGQPLLSSRQISLPWRTQIHNVGEAHMSMRTCEPYNIIHMHHMHMGTQGVQSIPVALTNSTERYFKHKGLCQVQNWPLWCKSIWIASTLLTIKLLLHYIHTTPPHTAPTMCYITLLPLPRPFNLKALYVYLKQQRPVYGSTAHFHTTSSTVLFW